MFSARSLARLAASVAVITTGLALAGCSGAGSGGGSGSSGARGSAAVENFAGGPKGVVDRGESALAPYASWLDSGEQIALTLYGSSGCPPIGERMRVASSNSLVVSVVPIPPDKACTADYAPHTTVFATPEDVTTDSDVSIRVDDQSITLKAMR
ncbi:MULTISPECIES: hypothetical protein [unclassified Leifsonia]|uniref:hypothetical protein n=1 Tax=unclassified Leifsonia TaxID=2663824 RepID=UPI0006F4B97A|nr:MULTISPECIES: hypothetical protein [unclassified Leifsonia]KQX08019.1 hypothetical protein ASC59_10025 [Leifsonia sp. Root1293]KRA12300.1 hypothetical protein ASD61_10025 [Leifsonia sp. Root60]